MTAGPRFKKGSDPRCWWCHCSLKPMGGDSGFRGEAPGLIELPSGVVVCSPQCPERPDGVRVWRVGAEFGAAL